MNIVDTEKKNNCLSNLERCKASCCRLVTFDIKLDKRPRLGSILKVNVGKISEDMKYYYYLHGFTYNKGTLEIKLYRYNYRGGILYVHTKCKGLTEDNLCRFHGTKNKPFVCTDLNSETIKTKNYMLTEGCIYGD